MGGRRWRRHLHHHCVRASGIIGHLAPRGPFIFIQRYLIFQKEKEKKGNKYYNVWEEEEEEEEEEKNERNRTGRINQSAALDALWFPLFWSHTRWERRVRKLGGHDDDRPTDRPRNTTQLEDINFSTFLLARDKSFYRFSPFFFFHHPSQLARKIK